MEASEAGGGAEDRVSSLSNALLVSAKAHADAGAALLDEADADLVDVQQAAVHASAAFDYMRARDLLHGQL